MAYLSVTNTFTAGTNIKASEVNQNFTDVENALSDGTLDLNMNDVTVGGNLAVTGTSVFTGAITANGGITLGAGDDLIGSATSDITFNTDKFTVAGATGNTAVGGTLGVTGAATLSSTLDVTGNFSVNSGKFSVTAANGDTTVDGQLAVTSDFTINTNKFSVIAASGNTTIAGTLGVTSDFTINTNKFTVLAADGSTAIAGNLTLSDVNVILGTTTGTQFGSAANQKLSFFGATPVVQLAKASYNNWAAFTDVVDALVAIGLFDAA